MATRRYNPYDLEIIEQEILGPSNLRFKRNAANEIAEFRGLNGIKEGIYDVENVPARQVTEAEMLESLYAARRAEKEFMRTGKRVLETDGKDFSNDIDYERSDILSNLLTNEALSFIAKRGMHGAAMGDRDTKVTTVRDMLNKGTYYRDPYTGASIQNILVDQGHLEAAKDGGTRLRPENSLVNQWLQATEGAERLAAIDVAIDRVGAARALNKFSVDEILDSPEMAKVFNHSIGKKVLDRAQKNANLIHFSGLNDTMNVDERKLTSPQSNMRVPVRKAGENPAILELASGSRKESPGDSKERGLYIDSGGGDVSIGQDVLRSNGNGKHKNGNGH